MAISLTGVSLGLPASDPSPTPGAATFTMRLDTTSGGHGGDNTNSLHFEFAESTTGPWNAITSSGKLQTAGTNPQTWSSATTQYSITVEATENGTYYVRGRSSGDDGPFTTSSQVVTASGFQTTHTSSGAPSIPLPTASGVAVVKRKSVDDTFTDTFATYIQNHTPDVNLLGDGWTAFPGTAGYPRITNTGLQFSADMVTEACRIAVGAPSSTRELVARCSWTGGGANNRFSLMLHASPDSGSGERPSDYYRLNIRPGDTTRLRLDKRDNGASTTLQDETGTSLPNNTKYWIELRVRSGSQEGRMWADGDPYPTTPNVSGTDSAANINDAENIWCYLGHEQYISNTGRCDDLCVYVEDVEELAGSLNQASVPLPTAAGVAKHKFFANGAPSVYLPVASGSALLKWLANGTPSIALPTASGAGQVTRTASGTPSIALPTAAGVADVQGKITATGSPSIGLPTASGSAQFQIKVWANSTASLSGAVRQTIKNWSATSITLGPLIQGGLGTGAMFIGVENTDGQTDWYGWTASTAGGKTATGSPSLPAVTASGVSQLTRTASGAPSVVLPTAAGSAQRVFVASGAPSMSVPTASGVGVVTLRSSGAPSIALPTASGSAVRRVLASGAPSLALPTASGSGQITLRGTGTPVVALPTASGTGSVSHFASGSPSVYLPVAAGVASINGQIAGNGAPVLPLLTSSGVAQVTRVASDGAPLISLPVASGSAVRRVTATGAPSVALPLPSGQAQLTRKAQGSPVVFVPVAAGAASVAGGESASGAPVVPLPVAAGVAQVAYRANGAPVVPLPFSSGAAQVIHKASGAASIALPLSSGVARFPGAVYDETVVTAPVGALGSPSSVVFPATGYSDIERFRISVDMDVERGGGRAKVVLTANGVPICTFDNLVNDAVIGAGAQFEALKTVFTGATPTVQLEGVDDQNLFVYPLQLTSVDLRVQCMAKTLGTFRTRVDLRVPRVTAIGTVRVKRVASGAPSMPAVAGSGLGARYRQGVVRYASGAVSVAPVSAVGNSRFNIAALSAVTMPAVTSSGAGTLTPPIQRASGTPAIPSMIGAGSANVTVSGFAPDDRRTFSGGTDGQDAVGSNAFGWSGVSGRIVYDSSVAGAIGGQCARYDWQVGDERVGNSINYPAGVGHLGEFWVRVRAWFPSSFNFDTNIRTLKFFRPVTQYWCGGQYWGGGAVDTQFDNNLGSTVIGINQLSECIRTVTPEGSATCGSDRTSTGNVFTPYTIPFDQWVTFEQYVKVDGRRTADEGGAGLTRFWINGTLVNERTGIQTLWNTDANSEHFQFLFIDYWNGLCPANQSCYIDEYVFTDGGNPPPNTDGSGNAYIGLWTP